MQIAYLKLYLKKKNLNHIKKKALKINSFKRIMGFTNCTIYETFRIQNANSTSGIFFFASFKSKRASESAGIFFTSVCRSYPLKIYRE